jgi:hypothetical protein
MKTLCLAFIINQSANEVHSPPIHIQSLIKKRIIHQLKQQDLDLQIYFDSEQCETIGTYQYMDSSLVISSINNQSQAVLDYGSILEGKSLELNSIKEMIQKKKNIEALVLTQNPESQVKNKKWLPWVIGSALLGLGGTLIYHSGSEKQSPAPRVRRFR